MIFYFYGPGHVHYGGLSSSLSHYIYEATPSQVPYLTTSHFLPFLAVIEWQPIPCSCSLKQVLSISLSLSLSFFLSLFLSLFFSGLSFFFMFAVWLATSRAGSGSPKQRIPKLLTFRVGTSFEGHGRALLRNRNGRKMGIWYARKSNVPPQFGWQNIRFLIVRSWARPHRRLLVSAKVGVRALMCVCVCVRIVFGAAAQAPFTWLIHLFKKVRKSTQPELVSGRKKTKRETEKEKREKQRSREIRKRECCMASLFELCSCARMWAFMCSVPWLSIPRSDKQQHWFEWLLLQIFHHPKTPPTTMDLRFACLSILKQREAPFTCQVHVCRESKNGLFFVNQRSSRSTV